MMKLLISLVLFTIGSVVGNLKKGATVNVIPKG
jgi:hypothetical protein